MLTRLLHATGRAGLAFLEALFPGPTDDTMAVAEAAGVVHVPAPRPVPDVELVIDWHAHPTHRGEFDDTSMEQMLLAWNRAAAGGDDQ